MNVYYYFKRSFYIITLAILLILIATALFCAFTAMPDREQVFLKPGEGYIIYIIAGSLLLSALLIAGYKIITGLSKYALASGIMFGIIILVQFIVSRIAINPITDCFTTIDEAIAMVSGQDGILNNKMPYFARYTNNHFFTVLMYYYFRIIRHIGADYFYSAVILNIFCIFLSVLGCYKIIDVLFGKKRALGVLFLLTLCPTTYLFVNFPYTNTFSMPFITGILYCGICFSGRNIKYGAGLIFFTVLGTLIRPTTAIALIAVIIYMIIRKRDMRLWGYLFGCLAVITVLLFCGSKFTEMHLENPDREGSFPATHWVMMGLKDKGEINTEDVLFTKSFSEKQDKIKANVKVIKDRVRNLGITGMTSLAAVKISELWSIGTDSFNEHHSSAVKYTGVYEHIYGNRNGWLIFYCQIFRIAELLMAFIIIVRMICTKGYCKLYPVILSLLGIMLFLMCWETNRKHNICFIPVLVMVMESGLDVCKNTIMPKVKFPVAIVGMMLIFVAGDILAVADKEYFTDVKRTVNDYSYFRLATRLKDIDNVISNNKCIRQEFKTYRPFNTVAVRFRADAVKKDGGSYRVSLYKEKSCVESLTADINDINDEGWYYMAFENSESYDEGNYTLSIEGEDGITDTMSPMIMTGIKMKPYRNTQLYVNNKKKNDSLMFYVYNTAERPVVMEYEWVLSFITVLVLQLCIISGMLYLAKKSA